MSCLLIIFIVACLYVIPANCIKCNFGQVFNNQTCERCRCGAGEEFNRTAHSALNKSDENGFLECPPCTTCPEGRYRESGSVFNKCRRCRQNCSILNKHWESFCGGSFPGQCGNCFTGFVPSNIDSNSACVNRTLREPSPSPTIGPIPVRCDDGYYLENGVCHRCFSCSQANKHMYTPCGGSERGHFGGCRTGFTMDRSGHCIDKRDTRKSPGSAKAPTDYQAAFMVLGIGAIVLVLLRIFVKWSRRLIVCSFRACCSERHDDGSGEESPVYTQASNDLSHDVQLDVDGPVVRGELPEPRTEHELCALLPPNPEVLFDQKLCIEFSKVISGDEEVLAFFRSLGVPEPIYNPHRDFFFNGKHSFREYVYRSMIEWTQLKTREATLDKVCSAMKDTTFGSKVPELLQTYQSGRPKISEINEHVVEIDGN